jgi:hypothetical protein
MLDTIACADILEFECCGGTMYWHHDLMMYCWILDYLLSHDQAVLMPAFDPADILTFNCIETYGNYL